MKSAWLKKVDPIAGWVFRHSGRDMPYADMHPKVAVLHSTFRFWRPIIYIYILATWVVAIEISRTCTECLRAQSLCLFFISNQCATHYTSKVSCKLDFSLPKHPGKMMSQQMLSQPVAGCETFGRSWCSRSGLSNVEDVFFKVFCPLFPLALSLARVSLQNIFCHHYSFASIDSWFDFQQYDAAILFSSLSLVVPYSCVSCPLCGSCSSSRSGAFAAAAAAALPLRIVHLQILSESSRIHLPVNFWTCRGSRMSGTKMLKYMQTHPHPE